MYRTTSPNKPFWLDVGDDVSLQTPRPTTENNAIANPTRAKTRLQDGKSCMKKLGKGMLCDRARHSRAIATGG